MSGRLCLRNRQRLRSIDLPLLRRIVSTLLEELLPARHFDLAIHLVRAPEITRLNETFLHLQGPTDVITFDYAGQAGPAADLLPRPPMARSSTPPPRRLPSPLDPESRVTDASALVHGELFVCLDEAVGQCRRFNTFWQSELVRYIVHGILHLLGYDDRQPAARRQMKREEDRRLTQLAERFPFRRLGKTRPAA
jgi:rRNA maturation RNase YbeY